MRIGVLGANLILARSHVDGMELEQEEGIVIILQQMADNFALEVTRCQFHQHFRSSFYSRISQKRKKMNFTYVPGTHGDKAHGKVSCS